VFLYDIDVKKYYDFSAHYSACSLRHNHPELIKGIVNNPPAKRVGLRASKNPNKGLFVRIRGNRI